MRATQFETITAAAFAAFAAAEVDVAVVEAGLGGRYDATNVMRSRVVLLTNVGLEHTDVLGETIEEIATEKLAVVHSDDTVVVLPDDTLMALVPRGKVVVGGAREAAAAFLGHPVEETGAVALPGRLERRPGEIRDGAHNPDGLAWLSARCPPPTTPSAPRSSPTRTSTRCFAVSPCWAPIRGDAVIEHARAGRVELAESARRSFRGRGGGADPTRAVRRAHELGEPVLVTGSLYLLADLEAAASPMRRRSRMRERLTVLTFALLVVASIVGIAFAAGYILGKLLL